MTLSEVARQIAMTPQKGKRRLVALVGAPASGKSTLADRLAMGHSTWRVMPMDGFHLDNALLDQRGLRARKGSPPTFDALGLQHLIARVVRGEEVYYPLFDRARDASINCAGFLGPEVDTVIVEGNYLLLDDPAWQGVHAHWDLSIMLNVPLATLKKRLIKRWRDHGYTPQAAARKIQDNDLPNAELVLAKSKAPDLILDASVPID